LPGTKRAMAELPQAALTRLLQGDMVPFADSIIFTDVSHEVSSKVSPKYGMQTKYSRTVYEAEIKQEFRNIDVPTSVTRPTTPITTPITTPRKDILRASGLRTQGKGVHVPVTTVHIIVDHRQREITYAWLTPEDVELLSGPDKKQVFHEWMASLKWGDDVSGVSDSGQDSDEATPGLVLGSPLLGGPSRVRTDSDCPGLRELGCSQNPADLHVNSINNIYNDVYL